MKANRLLMYFRYIPLKISVSSKKVFRLNMNMYRNSHHMVLSKAKNEFKLWFNRAYGESDDKVLAGSMGPVELVYSIYFPTKRIDVVNVGCVVDKFMADCLVENGYILEDNRSIIPKVSFEDCGIDRKNPRAELGVYKV